jgi:hypothetical protein
VVNDTDYTTGGTVSAGMCARLDSTGKAVVAYADDLGSPAVGVFADNAASGASCKIFMTGPVSTSAYNYIVNLGKVGYVGADGLPTNTPPSTSGSYQQRIAVLGPTAKQVTLMPEIQPVMVGV